MENKRRHQRLVAAASSRCLDWSGDWRFPLYFSSLRLALRGPLKVPFSCQGLAVVRNRFTNFTAAHLVANACHILRAAGLMSLRAPLGVFIVCMQKQTNQHNRQRQG